jgi:hypothetical protein
MPEIPATQEAETGKIKVRGHQTHKKVRDHEWENSEITSSKFRLPRNSDSRNFKKYLSEYN